MLAEVAEPQAGVAEDLAAVEILFAQKDAQQGAFPGPIAADESDLWCCRELMVASAPSRRIWSP